jgi:hypothetical protein
MFGGKRKGECEFESIDLPATQLGICDVGSRGFAFKIGGLIACWWEGNVHPDHARDIPNLWKLLTA